MLISKYVMMKSNTYMKRYYEERGYCVGKRGSYFKISVNDLSPNSNAIVDIKCDFCGSPHKMQWTKYLSTKESGNCCKKCRYKKIVKVNMIRHGVENTSQLSSVKEKRKNTCLKRYGVSTNLKLESTKKKIRETNLKKYGDEYTMRLPEFQEKIRKTNIEKYGFSYPMKNPNIVAKVASTLYKNGTCPSSKAQIYLGNLLGGKLNFPVWVYNLDILLDNNIYVEYDGSGHNLLVRRGEISEREFKRREIIRYNYLKKLGYKMIKIKNYSDKLPQDSVIIESINNALLYFSTTSRNFISIDFDELRKQ